MYANQNYLPHPLLHKPIQLYLKQCEDKADPFEKETLVISRLLLDETRPTLRSERVILQISLPMLFTIH